MSEIKTGTYFEEDKLDIVEEKIKICPLLDDIDEFVEYKKERCAWYDEENNQYILITIGRKE